MNNAEKCKAYYYKNREKRLAKLRAYQEENREKYLAQRRARYRAKTRPWQESREESALKLVMEAVNSPYTKVNDGGYLHPHENDAYSEDCEPEGAVWIAARPNVVLVGPKKYSYEPWVKAVIEAQDRVYSLVQRGHANARAVVDLHYEMAFACDDCGLWAHVSHVSRFDKFSEESEGGELLTESCDPTAIHRLFGKEFDPASAFDRAPQTDYGDDSSQARRGVSNAATAKKYRG